MRNLYKNSKDNSFRYVLGVNGANPLIFFGINPSTATSETYDKTIMKVESIAKIKKYDSWIMLNIYSQRATNPDNLDETLNTIRHKTNKSCINAILQNNSTIVAAWGNNIKKRPYLIDCLRNIIKDISGKKLKWYCIGDLSKKGNPKHPLYLRTDENLNIFDIEYYVKNYDEKYGGIKQNK